MTSTADGRLALVERLVDAVGVEAARLDPRAAIAWDPLPDVGSMVRHVGAVQRWVATVLRTGRPAPQADPGRVDDLVRWYRRGADDLLAALREVPPETPCWVLGGPDRTAASWRRRMVFEHAKHLIDLRAAGGGRWRPADELDAAAYADGIDELLQVFVPRASRTLPVLPGGVELVAADLERTWRIGSDWSDGDVPVAARVTASAAHLALLLWERADPLRDEAFAVDGDRGAVAALAAARVHGW